MRAGLNQLWLLSHEDLLLHQLLRTRRRHGSTDMGHSGRQFRILRNRFLPTPGTRGLVRGASSRRRVGGRKQ